MIASGPSLCAEDVNRLKGRRVLAINNNYQMAPWAEVLYACDGHWWGWHAGRPELEAFKGRKFTQDKEAAQKYGLEYVEGVDEPGLSARLGRIHLGSNSGIQAINLAYHLGAIRIVLLGFDMQATEGKKHWHEDHPNQDGDYGPWHKWIWRYELVASDAKRLGIEIFNCSRQTALKCFPRLPLSSLLLDPA